MKAVDAVKVTRWIEKNKSEVESKTRHESAAACFSDTGVKVSVDVFADIEKELGIKRVTGGQYGRSTISHNRVRCLAREMVSLMEQLGVTPSEAVKQIANGGH